MNGYEICDEYLGSAVAARWTSIYVSLYGERTLYSRVWVYSVFALLWDSERLELVLGTVLCCEQCLTGVSASWL